MFMMVSFDAGVIIDGLAQLLTVFLVTLPGSFISETLDTGVLRTIWVSLFGNANIIKASFILASTMGVYAYFRQEAEKNNRIRKGARM